MKTAHELLSLKKYNLSSIDERIERKEENIKHHLPNIFSDVMTAENVGKDLIFLARMKDARLLMSSNSYKAYEQSGKLKSYDEFLNDWHSSL